MHKKGKGNTGKVFSETHKRKISNGVKKSEKYIKAIYEQHHDNQVFEDLKRENEICNKLNCDFVIIWDK